MKRLVCVALCASIATTFQMVSGGVSSSLSPAKIVAASCITRALLSNLKYIMGSQETRNAYTDCAKQYNGMHKSDAQELLRRPIISLLPSEQQQELVRDTTQAFISACTCCMHHYYTDYGRKLWTIHVNEAHDGSYEVKFPTIGSIIRNEKVYISTALIGSYPTLFLNHMERLEPRETRRCLNHNDYAK